MRSTLSRCVDVRSDGFDELTGRPLQEASVNAEFRISALTSRFLFVYRPGELPARTSRLEVATGARQPWRTVMPADPTGVTFIRTPHFSRDGETCAYSYSRRLSNLHLVRGLR